MPTGHVPGPQYNVSYFAGRMGKYLDMNGSIMLAFGSTGFERPIAGLPRRCLDQDDLNGTFRLRHAATHRAIRSSSGRMWAPA